MNTRETHATRVISNRTSVRQRVVDVWRYRELLVGLVRKELKVKYKNSVLGFVWSMLTPTLYLVVFYFVFQRVLRTGIPSFAIFLLSGLLVWNLFSGALHGATNAVVGNAALVKKVAFPREILALAAVGAAVVNFCYQAAVLLAALVVFRHAPAPSFMLLLPVALVVLVLLAAGLGVLLAAVNVYARDTAYLLELVLLAWFWMTPIVYQYRLVADRLGADAWIYRLNPMTPIVLTFQRAIYNRTEPFISVGDAVQRLPVLPAAEGPAWYLAQLAGVAVVATAVLVLGLAVFGRFEGNFAEEL